MAKQNRYYRSLGPTPLARYLREHEMANRIFAQLVGAARGYPVSDAVVSGWVTGNRLPGVAARAAIAAASHGAIRVSAWAKSGAKKTAG